MPVREAPDRRGRRVRGSVGLLDREPALRVTEAVLDAACEGHGRALLFEGHAGIGKTRLHEAALDRARERGMRVLRAAGAELEREIALGVAGQLLEAQLRALPEQERALVLDQAPLRIRALAGLAPPALSGTGDGLSVSHGLFTLIATADETRPALIAIDDLHWCDAASLEFILYLLHRLEELPLALVMSWRHEPGEPLSDVLDRIASHHRVDVERLSALGRESVAELAEHTFGELADDEVIDACFQATSGNPFYLHELLLALRHENGSDPDELARHARALVPNAVIRTLRVRVGRIGPHGVALARALAVLGDDTPLRLAAGLANLSIEDASTAADALAAVEILLAREPLRFVHPLVRHAIENDIPASELAGRHLEAARRLWADGGGSERVAAHLLLGRAEGSAWAVEQLRAAAREARGRAAPQSAVRYLERAVEEPPASELLSDVLGELGAAEAAAGRASAAEHLERAAAASPDPYRRAQLALQQGHALYNEGRYERAALVYDHGVAELTASERGGPEALELRDELQTGFAVAAAIVDRLRPQALERSAQLLDRAVASGSPTHGQRLLLAQAALHASLAGEPASRVIELAERGWDSGRLLRRDTADGIAWLLLASSICMSGELERSIQIADQVLAEAQRRGSPLAFATASYFRATPERWQGRVTEALADLEQARDARRYGWRRFARSAAANYALCLIETGELDRAERTLSEDAPLEPVTDLEDARRLYALAELRLAQGRPREAFETALTAGAAIERTVAVWGYCPWRSAAAQAALAMGEREQARELARAAVELSERIGAAHARIRGLRILGLCEPGEDGLELLRRAAELAGSGPTRLEGIRALVDFGAALRRGNHRAAAREPLQTAADLALLGGATVVNARARTELAAAGARPRRTALRSGPASLTPSERRIAELAAGGHSNREISQILFVTPKTVEYHLRNAYRKLDIESRRELARVLITHDHG
jgi:DNA-binding CsgD family transcriptional regulator/tetratricopeptide (TPR) repeat protein